MRRHPLAHWRGTGQSQAARRGMTSTVRSDDQFVSTNPIQCANSLFCLAAWGLFEGTLRNGFIHVGLPLQNYRHTSFGLASSWWWGEGALSPTLHLTNSWISHHLGLQEDLDEEELTSDSDCRFQMSMFWLLFAPKGAFDFMMCHYTSRNSSYFLTQQLLQINTTRSM